MLPSWCGLITPQVLSLIHISKRFLLKARDHRVIAQHRPIFILIVLRLSHRPIVPARDHSRCTDPKRDWRKQWLFQICLFSDGATFHTSEKLNRHTKTTFRVHKAQKVFRKMRETNPSVRSDPRQSDRAFLVNWIDRFRDCWYAAAIESRVNFQLNGASPYWAVDGLEFLNGTVLRRSNRREGPTHAGSSRRQQY